MKLNNKVYDALKWIALIALPAMETLWIALGNTWGFPYVEQIATTIAAIDACMGVLLGISTYSYNKEV